MIERGTVGGTCVNIGDTISQILRKQDIDVVTSATFVRTEQRGTQKRLVLTVDGTERVLEGDALLVATGRTPNTESLDLAAAGVEVGTRGEIVVDDSLRTSNPRVFAAGDVTLGPQYVYVAAYEGALAAENALGGERLLDLRAVPGVTFTMPSIATVGFTEEAARRAGHEVKATVLPLHAVPRALVNRDTDRSAMNSDCVVDPRELTANDVARVGGKNASSYSSPGDTSDQVVVSTQSKASRFARCRWVLSRSILLGHSDQQYRTRYAA